MSSTAYQKGQQQRLENWPCFSFFSTSTNMLSRAARWLRPRAHAGEATSATRAKPPDVRTPKLACLASWPLLGWRRRHAATPFPSGNRGRVVAIGGVVAFQKIPSRVAAPPVAQQQVHTHAISWRGKTWLHVAEEPCEFLALDAVCEDCSPSDREFLGVRGGAARHGRTNDLDVRPVRGRALSPRAGAAPVQEPGVRDVQELQPRSFAPRRAKTTLVQHNLLDIAHLSQGLPCFGFPRQAAVRIFENCRNARAQACVGNFHRRLHGGVARFQEPTKIHVCEGAGHAKNLLLGADHWTARDAPRRARERAPKSGHDASPNPSHHGVDNNAPPQVEPLAMRHIKTYPAEAGTGTEFAAYKRGAGEEIKPDRAIAASFLGGS